MSTSQPTNSVKFTPNSQGSFTALEVIKNPQHLENLEQAKAHLFASTSRIINDKNMDAHTLSEIENEANTAKEVYEKHNNAKLSQANLLASPISNAAYITTLICVSASGLYILFVPVAFLLSSASNLYMNIKKTGLTKKNMCLFAGVLISASLTVLAVLALAGLATPLSPLIIVSIAVLSDIIVGAFASQLNHHDAKTETDVVLDRMTAITTFVHTAEKAQKPQVNQQKKALSASLKAHTYELCDRVREIKDPKEKKSYAKKISTIKYQRVMALIEQKPSTSSNKESGYYKTQQDLLQILSNPKMIKAIRKYQVKQQKGIDKIPPSLAHIDKKILTHFIPTPIFYKQGSKRWQSSEKGMTQMTLAARILSLNLPDNKTQAYLEVVKNLPNKPQDINNALATINASDPEMGKELFASYQDAKDLLLTSQKDDILQTLGQAEKHINKYYRREAPLKVFECILTIEVVLSIIGAAIALPFMASPPFMIAVAALVMLHCVITMTHIAYDKVPAFKKFITAGQESYESLIESASLVKRQSSKAIVKAVGLDTATQSTPTTKYAITRQSGLTSCVSTSKVGNTICKTASTSQCLTSTTSSVPTQKSDKPEPASKRPTLLSGCKTALTIIATALKHLKK